MTANAPTSAEVLQQVYERFGPIHPSSYDQAGAMQRVAQLNGFRGTNGLVSKSQEGDNSADNATAAHSQLCVLTLAELVGYDFPGREAILEPWLLTQSLSMIHAWRGIGKTHIALGIAYAVATGGEFLTWKAFKPRRVLYVD